MTYEEIIRSHGGKATGSTQQTKQSSQQQTKQQTQQQTATSYDEIIGKHKQAAQQQTSAPHGGHGGTFEVKPAYSVNALGAGSYGGNKSTRVDKVLTAAAQGIESGISNTLGFLMTEADEGYTGGKAGGMQSANKEAAKLTKEIQSGLYEFADKKAKQSQSNTERAKAGLGEFGQFVVDAGVAGAQMLGDFAANAIVPGSGLAALGVRAFGQSAQETRASGGSETDQFKSGMKSALIEVLTEKIGGPFEKLYGKSALSGVVNKVIARLPANSFLRPLAKFAINSGSEGMEEIIGGIANEIADRALKLDDGEGRIITKDEWEQILYEGLVGGTLGMFGATGNVIMNTTTAKKIYGAGEQELVNEAAQLPDAKANKLAEQYQKILNKGKHLTGAQLSALVENNSRVTESIRESNMTESISARLEALGFDGDIAETAKTIYDAAFKGVKGKAVNELYTVAAAERTLTELNDALEGAEMSTNQWAYDAIENMDTTEETAEDESLGLEPMTYEEQEDFLRERYADAIDNGTLTESTLAKMTKELRSGTPLEDMVRRTDGYVQQQNSLNQQERDIRQKYAQAVKDGVFTEEDINELVSALRNGTPYNTVLQQADEILEEINNEERNNADNGSMGRNTDTGAGEQSGRVREAAGRAEEQKRRDDSGREEAGRRDRKENEGKTPKVSGKDLKIPGATDNKTLTVVKPTGVEARIVKAFMPAAKSITLVNGDIERQTRGGIVKVSGLETSDGRIWARMDHKLYNGTKLLLHECGHLFMSDDAQLREKMHEAAKQVASEKQIETLAVYYSKIWKGLYKLPDGATYDNLGEYFETNPDALDEFLDTYMEEIWCDALAGLDRAKAPGASKLTDAIRAAFLAETGIDVEGILNGTVEGDTEITEAQGTAAEVEERAQAPPLTDDMSPADEIKFSTAENEKLYDKADKENKKSKFVKPAVMAACQKARNEIKQFLEENAEALHLPADKKGKTIFGNQSYGYSAENTTVCIRSLVQDTAVHLIEQQLGRKLEMDELIYAARYMGAWTGTPQCAYCYVAADRMAFDNALGKFLDERDIIFNAAKDGFSLEEATDMMAAGRSKTQTLKDRAAYWYDAAKAGKFEGRLEREQLAGIIFDDADIKAGRAKLTNDTQRKEYDLAIAYARSASHAKKRVSYRAYNGEILKLKQNVVDKLNEEFGLRFYSYSDYSPAFILENMQMITDGAVRGLKGLAYTKEIDFVRIFAPTGININVSVYATEENGKIMIDEMQGAKLDEAIELHKQYPNVGITLVATNDNIVEWALQQEWTDVVLPYHSVFSGGGRIAKYFGWTDYKAQQADKKTKLTPENAPKEIYPTVHNNDLITYIDAIIVNKMRPRFEQWLDSFEEYKTGEISAAEFRRRNPYYMKLVNETRRSAKDTPVMQPIFNTDAAIASLEDMKKKGGYNAFERAKWFNFAVKSVAGDIEKGKVKPENVPLAKASADELDDEYNDALFNNDMERAKELVDQAARAAGYTPVKRWHQTNARFTRFNTDNPQAGLNDSETPNGIFFKTNDHDIGLSGKIQMSVYLSTENTLHFANREEANQWYCDNVKGYKELQAEMAEAIKPIESEMDELEDKMFADDVTEDTYNKLDEEWNIKLAELGKIENGYRSRLRSLLDDYFLNGTSGYDSIELDYDGHRWVNGTREDVHTFIVFDPKQVKSADPVTYDDNGNVIPLSERFKTDNEDIRYSADELDEEYEDAIFNNDMERAQELVDQAARAAGYTVEAYHGTPKFGFKKFRDGVNNGLIWTSDDIEYAERYTEPKRKPLFGKAERDKNKVYHLGIKYNNLLDLGDVNDGIFKYGSYGELSDTMQAICEAIGYTADDITDLFGEDKLYYAIWTFTKTSEFKNALEAAKYDAVSAEEYGHRTYGVVKSEQLKLLDPVTYDDNGNVIPLSERFKTENEDIRYSAEEIYTQKDLDEIYAERSQIRDELAEIRRNGTTDYTKAPEYQELFDALMNAPRGTEEAQKAADDFSAFVNDFEEKSGAKRKAELESRDRELRRKEDEVYNYLANEREKNDIANSGMTEAEHFFKKATKEFGHTTSFREAGYMLPSGKLLNFSGEKGMHTGSRGQDHRGISAIFESTTGSAAMVRFMNYGAIRVMAEAPGIDISSEAEPTAEQYRGIKNFVRSFAREEYFNVDISDKTGSNIGSYEYEGRVNADRVVNDIKYFFETGEVREQSGLSAFYSADDYEIDDTEDAFYDAGYNVFGQNVKYSALEDAPYILDFLEDQEHITTYKSMQLIDGKLYPPMAAVVDGKLEDYSQLGKWEKAVEHPELIKLDKNGKPKFKLNKGKGQGSVDAAYNPYMHSSNLVLNDQFTGAYKRNLVTVECEIPISELTSGYQAQYAKDPVGMLSWHTGPVAAQLPKDKNRRMVYLTRWLKPVRIVPDEEVAKLYAELLNEDGISVPNNVVPASLLPELEKAGVKIDYTGIEKLESRVKNRYSADDAMTAEEVQRRKTVKSRANAMGMQSLRERVASIDGQISGLERVENRSDDMERELEQLKTDRDIFNTALEKKTAKAKQAKTDRQTAREAAEKARDELSVMQTTRRSRAGLKQQLFNIFSISNGMAELGDTIDAFVDTWVKNGKIGNKAIDKLEDILMTQGEVINYGVDEYAREVRARLERGYISVPEEVIAEFGDDWNDFRKRAFANKIYLTRESGHSNIDQWTMDLAATFGAGKFDDTVDLKQQLETIVNIAEDGREESLSLWQMAEYIRRTEGKDSMDGYIENLHQQLMQALQDFSRSAKIEIDTVKQNVYQNVRREAERKEKIERARREKEQREFQQKTLKQLQWLKRNQNFMGNDFQEEAKRILGDIDTIAISAANEMNWSEKHQATWEDLAKMYKWAEKNDPNFLPSKELENIVMRVEGKHLDELTATDLEDIYKAAVALRTAYYNRNNVINDELHRQFAEVFDESVLDMKAAPKPKKKTGKGRNYLDQQLNPIHRIERMFGWKENSPGFQIFGRGLEKGERMTKRYVEQANQMLDEWMTENEEWVRQSDGQGEDATWYELEVPELLEFRMGDSPIFGETVKVYMTPMQKVYMYLESKNYDNLRHMAGGRTFADKELYSQGEYTEAFAQGTTVSLAPETVKKIVSDLTPKEMELAKLLDKYFNEYAKTEINRVSNVLYGYDRAMSDNYAPIFTNSNYNKSEPGIYQDGTAEGVGHMKTRAQGAKNPTYNISALQAFNKHVSQTSRFVGMAIPAQNAKTLLNWSAHGVTMQDHITHEWSQKELDSLTKVMTELQAPTYMEQSEFAGALGKIMSNYIGGVFGANVTVAAKVLASKPTAAIVLGNDNYPSIAQQRAVDDDLVRKYTSELDVRIRGLGRPELAALTLDEGKYQRWVQSHKLTQLTLGGGLLQAADVYVARTMWAWAENKVRAEYPELEVGTQEQIDAGMSPFYKKVAEVYDNAIGDTQSMYDIMHRSDIMRDANEITRSFTIFHTDSLQAANLLRKRAGELQAAKAEGNEVRINTAKKAAAVAAGNVLLMNALVVMFDILRDLWRKRDDEYKNDDGDITFWSFTEEALQQLAESTSGLLIGLDAILPALESIFTGDTYFEHQIIAIDAFNDILNGGRDFGKSLKSFIEGFADVMSNDGDVWQYLTEAADFRGAVKDAAKNIVHYASGIPVNNVERLITTVLGRVWPQMAAAYDGIWDSGSKADLRKSSAIAADIMQLYTGRGDIDRDTANELARLYEAGFTDAVISDTPADFSVNGEKIVLTEADKQRYNAEIAKNLDGELSGLIESPEYQAATDEQKTKMLSKLYTYAAEHAKAEIDPEYDMSNWVETVPDLRDAGADWGQITEALVKQSELNKTDMKAGEKATAFAIWADGKGYTPAVKKAIKDAVTFFSMVPAEAKRYEDLTAAGISVAKAEEINDVLSELTPQMGSSQVSALQKVSAVSYMTISEADKEKAMKVIYSNSEKAYNRYMIARKHNVLSADYADFLETLDRIDVNGGNPSRDDFTEAVAKSGFNTEAAKEIWYTYWKSTSPWG